MTPVSQLLQAAAAGDRRAAADLLPPVYAELRQLAAARLAAEPAGHTLQPTALVHEAYLRLVGDQRFDGRGHFFAAAAEAMRRILIDHARKRRADKRGGDRARVELPTDLPAPVPDDDLLAVDEVIDQLAAHDRPAADLVRLHVFAGLTVEEAAGLLGVSPRTAFRTWAYARAWMFRRLENSGSVRPPDAHGG